MGFLHRGGKVLVQAAQEGKVSRDELAQRLATAQCQLCALLEQHPSQAVGIQQHGLSYLLFPGSYVFSYLDDWLIKMSVLLLSTKKRRPFFLRPEFIALCCNRVPQILSQATIKQVFS